MDEVMSVLDYRKFAIQAVKTGNRNEVRRVYFNLVFSFVLDCSIPLHEEYFGNNVKEKAKILAKLQAIAYDIETKFDFNLRA